MKIKLSNLLWIIFSCFSISLGSWFLIFAMTPNNIAWLLGTCSSWTGLMLIIALITGEIIPIKKENETKNEKEVNKN